MTGQYSEDQIISLEFDDGDRFDCGIMGIFAVEGKDYIALEALDGVASAEVSLENNHAIVNMTKDVPDEIIKTAIEEAYYEPGEISLING